MRVLVTGAAGFIGGALSEKLLSRGDEVFGVDNLNSYYDVRLKYARINRVRQNSRYRFAKIALEDGDAMRAAFERFEPQRVVNLAGQPGTRYSIEHPRVYVDSNLVGFANVLELCREFRVEHLVYASSSAVYGVNSKLPFSVSDAVDHPLSMYAATKKANELMAHCYSHLFALPTSGLRFFSVYGPWGRPDTALFIFTRKILAGEPIDLFNHGRQTRDFTYIDDAVEAIVGVLDCVATANLQFDTAQPSSATSVAPYRLYNIGNRRPLALSRYVEVLEECLGRRALKNSLPMQPGEMLDSEADVGELVRAIGHTPSTPIEAGVRRFVDWYRQWQRKFKRN